MTTGKIRSRDRYCYYVHMVHPIDRISPTLQLPTAWGIDLGRLPWSYTFMPNLLVMGAFVLHKAGENWYEARPGTIDSLNILSMLKRLSIREIQNFPQ